MLGYSTRPACGVPATSPAVQGEGEVRTSFTAMICVGVATAALSVTGQLAAAQNRSNSISLPPRVFAIVDGVRVSVEEYQQALAIAIRTKFFHRQPQEDALTLVQESVADELVNRILLLKEVRRRGILPEQEKIVAAFAAYEQRYGASPRWQQMRGNVKARLTEDNELSQLDAAVRGSVSPGITELRQYYQNHVALFTEPEQVRLSLILLRVDPSSPRSAWDKARQEAEAILKRLASGADFSEAARLHSSDTTAQNGGDMGYLHRGMLPQDMYKVIDKLHRGELSPPLQLLEGIAIVRLEDRIAARLKDFEDVRQRVSELYLRERGMESLKKLIDGLRKNAVISIDWSQYLAASVARPPRDEPGSGR
jgi:parvulin-like peptidyl-prolyl isomerase